VTQQVYTAWRKRKALPARDVFLITADEIVAIYKHAILERHQGERPAGRARLLCV
jgi:lysozyme family protein